LPPQADINLHVTKLPYCCGKKLSRQTDGHTAGGRTIH